jgi:hypothetical protein
VTLAAPTDALDAALRVAHSLEERAVPYALGGALAYGLWGVPRATLDVDLNVFVEPEALGPVFEAFAALGIPVDPTAAQDSVGREGMFQAMMGEEDPRVQRWDELVSDFMT